MRAERDKESKLDLAIRDESALVPMTAGSQYSGGGDLIEGAALKF